MAERKSIDTGPRTDGGVKNYQAPTVALSEAGFNSFVRLIKTGRIAQLSQLQEAVGTAMKRLRLRLRSKGTDPVAGIPNGSDQVDVGTLVRWTTRITKGDAAAKDQLVKVSATIRQRLA